MFQCQRCGMKLSTRDEFKRHVRDRHGYDGSHFEEHEDDNTLSAVVGAALVSSMFSSSPSSDPSPTFDSTPSVPDTPSFDPGGGDFGGAGSSGDF